MILLEWLAGGAAVLAAILFAVVPWVTRPAAVEAQGVAQAVTAGGVLAFLVVAGAAFLANPDHMQALRPRAVEAAVLAAASAVIWLPVYLVAARARLRRRRRGE